MFDRIKTFLHKYAGDVAIFVIAFVLCTCACMCVIGCQGLANVNGDENTMYIADSFRTGGNNV